MVIDLTTLAADRVPVVADIPASAMDVPAEGVVALEERYDDTPPVGVHVVALA